MTVHAADTAWRGFLSGKAGFFFGEGTESLEVCLWCGYTATEKVQIGMMFLYKYPEIHAKIYFIGSDLQSDFISRKIHSMTSFCM